MRNRAIYAISIGLAACTLAYPISVSAQDSRSGSAADPSSSSGTAQTVASEMVPAQAILDQRIDAKTAHPGEQFRAKLSKTVHLKNGVELPRDTVLVGTVATDNMNHGATGTSTLALRFTNAQLKDGKVLPVQADIMAVGPPSDSSAGDYNNPGASILPWDGRSVQVDEPGAMSGFDFHSRIGGANSGVFVSTKKDEVKLSSGSQLSLAIAAKNATPANGGI